MIIKEYFRYIKSKFNLFLLSVLTIIGVLSYCMSYAEKKMFIGQLSSNSKDLNYQALESLINNYTGMKFFTNFLFSNDFYQIFTIILFAGLGIFLATIHFQYKETGYGNLVITRRGFGNYLRDICIAQTLYITTLILSVMTLLFLTAFILGGLKFTFGGIGEYELSFGQGVIIALLHIMLLIIYSVFVNLITLLTPLFINNKYLIQAFPIITFIIVPIILGSTLANVSPSLGFVIYNLIPFITLSIIPTVLTTDISMGSVLIETAPFIILVFISFLLYRLNIKRFSKDYL